MKLVPWKNARSAVAAAVAADAADAAADAATGSRSIAQRKRLAVGLIRWLVVFGLSRIGPWDAG